MVTLRNAGLCLLLASMIGTTMYGYSGDAELQTVFGAAIGADCKDPCDDTWITSVIECDDVAGIPPKDKTKNGCHKGRCTINSLRYATCTPKDDAGSGAKDCKTHQDPNDWRRWIIVREMPCTDGGKHSISYGKCGDSGGFPGATTPCKSDSCFGPIYNGIDYAEAKNRTRCGP